MTSNGRREPSASEEISVISSERPLQPTMNRGGIKIFGFKSRLASDDFVLPAWIAFLCRLFFLTATLAIMVYSIEIKKTGPSCLKLHSLDIYMPTILSIMTLNAIVYFLLAFDSAKGVIWDPNPRSRRFVSPLFHISMILGVGEILMVINGTIWIASALSSDCAKSPAEQTSMYVILGLIIFKWIGIGLTFIILWISLKDLWPICCCRSRGKGKRGQLPKENASQWIINHVSDPGECCFYLFKRCCVASKQVDYFNDVADLINEMFEDEAFVPTDVAAALILLWEKNNQRSIVSRSMKNKEIHLRHLSDYMSYAFASYGCAMYLIDNDAKFQHCWNMASKLSLCSCCCCFSSNSFHEFSENDNCCLGNLATLQLKVPYIQQDDIIHLSMRNKFLETPFMVIADPKLQKIIVSIRGTLSLADLMTDMVAKPVSLKAILQEEITSLDFTPQEIINFTELPEDIEVHVGMAEAAIYVYKKIKEKHLLEKAYVHYPDFPIVVTGHSLGAGTAVILAFILRLKYYGVKCVSFGPPGGLLNPFASKLSTDFVTSVVYGDDIIPRMSVNGYIKLRSKMKKALIRCKLPKHKVLATGFCNCLSPVTWKNRLRNDPAVKNEDSEDEAEQLNTYGSTNIDIENDAYSTSTRNWSQMLPPGKIIHIYNNASNNDEISMTVRDPHEFNEILVSTKMIHDHNPSSYQKAIAMAKERFSHNANSIEDFEDINPSV